MPDQTAPPSQKCPYLAGRPPHGSYHMMPSGVNVCFARTREEKPYGQVSKETQSACCFGGDTAYGGCADFASARERGLEIPVFDGKALDEGTGAEVATSRSHVRRERRRQRRRTPLSARLAVFSQSTVACLCWALLMAVAYWLVRRTM